MKLIKNISILSALFAGTSFGANDSNSEIENNNNERQNTDLIQNHTPEDDSVREYFETDASDNDQGPSKFAQAPAADDAGAAAVGAPTGTTTDAGAAPTGTPAKVKKKKKKAATGDQAAMASGHGVQESGLPYKAGVDMSLTYSSESKTKKYSDKSQKESTTAMGLDLDYLFVFGHLEAGPKITFLSMSEKTPTVNVIGTTLSDEKKTSAIGFGAAFVIDIGNIHQDSLVPYVDFDLVKESKTVTSTTGGSSDSTKVTDTDMRIGLGGGVKIFMGGHIALKPFLKYELIMGGSSKKEETNVDTAVASVTGNKLSLGMGLAKYF